MAQPPVPPPTNRLEPDSRDHMDTREILELDAVVGGALSLIADNEGEPPTLMDALLKAGMGDINDKAAAMRAVEAALKPGGSHHDLTKGKRWKAEGAGQKWADGMVDRIPSIARYREIHQRVVVVEEARHAIDKSGAGPRTKAAGGTALDKVAEFNGKRLDRGGANVLSDAIRKTVAEAAAEAKEAEMRAAMERERADAVAARREATLAKEMAYKMVEGLGGAISAALTTSGKAPAP